MSIKTKHASNNRRRESSPCHILFVVTCCLPQTLTQTLPQTFDLACEKPPWLYSQRTNIRIAYIRAISFFFRFYFHFDKVKRQLFFALILANHFHLNFHAIRKTQASMIDGKNMSNAIKDQRKQIIKWTYEWMLQIIKLLFGEECHANCIDTICEWCLSGS